jgi:hypothetical protein
MNGMNRRRGMNSVNRVNRREGQAVHGVHGVTEGPGRYVPDSGPK